jgi:signal transduction histidine kinase
MIMERHGGTVSAAAVPGQGTEFVLTLNAENLEAGRG